MARQKRLRNAIVKTLRENPQGLTANQIIDRLPDRQRKSASNAGHVSNLIRGMKNINKIKVQLRESGSLGGGAYTVNQYFYEEEGAEI